VIETQGNGKMAYICNLAGFPSLYTPFPSEHGYNQTKTP